jgi:hypothetical protein
MSSYSFARSWQAFIANPNKSLTDFRLLNLKFFHEYLLYDGFFTVASWPPIFTAAKFLLLPLLSYAIVKTATWQQGS